MHRRDLIKALFATIFSTLFLTKKPIMGWWFYGFGLSEKNLRSVFIHCPENGEKYGTALWVGDMYATDLESGVAKFYADRGLENKHSIVELTEVPNVNYKSLSPEWIDELKYKQTATVKNIRKMRVQTRSN